MFLGPWKAREKGSPGSCPGMPLGEQRARGRTEHDAARASIGAWLGAYFTWPAVVSPIQLRVIRTLNVLQPLVRCSYAGDPCVNIVYTYLVSLVLYFSVSYHYGVSYNF